MRPLRGPRRPHRARVRSPQSSGWLIAMLITTARRRRVAPGSRSARWRATPSMTAPCAVWALAGTTSSSGRFEPAGSVSIDKPPIDLWLQVVSVKLFGFSADHAEAARGLRRDASVPLLFAAVRRMRAPARGSPPRWRSRSADRGDHLSQRHDGAVMMALLVLALLAWCVRPRRA